MYKPEVQILLVQYLHKKCDWSSATSCGIRHLLNSIGYS